MTYRQLYDFYVGQVAWYEKQNDFCNRQIAYCNRELKRERARDKELAEYALSTCSDDPMTVKIFGGKYVGSETKKLINERAKYYREIKYNNKRIAYYQKEADNMLQYIG